MIANLQLARIDQEVTLGTTGPRQTIAGPYAIASTTGAKVVHHRRLAEKCKCRTY